MRLREINLGCFGGGTGLPSLLGGLKRNPWLRLNAVVTMFDSGGSSGQLRDELGVLPPGDVLRCALALSRNEGEARRVLLARLPTLEHARLGGHTGGNLLLSMMERYSGDFLAAVDGLRALLGCRGSVWPISVEHSTLCAEYADGQVTRGEVEVDQGHARGHHVTRVWLEPPAPIHPAVQSAIAKFDAVVIGPGSFFTSLMPTLLVDGVAEVIAGVHGPHRPRQQPADRRAGHAGLHRRGRSVVGQQDDRPQGRRRDRQSRASRRRRRSSDTRRNTNIRCRSVISPAGTEAVVGDFWRSEIARHDRQRLSYAVWSVLSQRLLT